MNMHLSVLLIALLLNSMHVIANNESQPPKIIGGFIFSEYFPIDQSTLKGSDLTDIKSVKLSFLNKRYSANLAGFGRTCDNPEYSYREPTDENDAYSASILSGGELTPLGIIQIKCPGDDYFTASFEIFSEIRIGWYFDGYYIFFSKQ